MIVALTGATGFVGRHVANRLTAAGHSLRCWKRPHSDLGGFERPEAITWIDGTLRDAEAVVPLLEGAASLVHAALWRPGEGFRGAEGDLLTFTKTNLLGSLRLFQAAAARSLPRTVFISTCAVHERVLDDRPLDETHPLWPRSHYGAHKAALEAFVHSYGLGEGVPICALRPSGVFGVDHPVERSKWFDLVQRVVASEAVEASGGGKEVHAADVAQAVEVLLNAPAEAVTGEAFSCCDRPIARLEVAEIARELSGSSAAITGDRYSPRHTIETGKLEALGMRFRGDELLSQTLAELVADAQR